MVFMYISYMLYDQYRFECLCTFCIASKVMSADVHTFTNAVQRCKLHLCTDLAPASSEVNKPLGEEAKSLQEPRCKS